MKPRFPPIFQIIFGGLISRGMTTAIPQAAIPFPMLKYAGFGLVAVGAVILVASVFKFSQEKTTINPLDPEQASELVISGLYRLTRNPMYLGLALILLGYAAYLQNLAALVGPIVFLFTMTYLQIKPEEAALTKKFGLQYDDYRHHVRRWL